MRIEIVTIGNEILEGHTANANAFFLSRELTERGYEILRHTVLPDDSELLLQGLREALDRSTLVIATGGLGPTMDDLTKRISSRLFRAPLQVNSSLYDDLKKRFGEEGSIHEQSTVPHEATLLPNEIGTAPGFLFLSIEGSLLLLPGAPREMEVMFLKQAVPLLTEHFPLSAKLHMRRFSLCLMREAQVDPLLRTIQEQHPDARIGVYPSFGSLQICLRVSERPGRLDEWVGLFRKAFPTHFFEEPNLERAIHRILLSRKKTLAFAESCTGGALSARVVSMENASQYFLGSLVVYSNGWKEQLLHVRSKTLIEYGAASHEVVQEMMQGVFQETAADYAIAISGIAGPGGGSEQTPVGTVFLGIGERGGLIDVGRIQAPSERLAAIEFSVQYALGALWRRLAYETPTFSS